MFNFYLFVRKYYRNKSYSFGVGPINIIEP